MSDLELSEVSSHDTDIKTALRETVQRCFRENRLEELTVKRVRSAVEERLQLPPDFLKSNPKWKECSKNIINNEVTSSKEHQANVTTKEIQEQEKAVKRKQKSSNKKNNRPSKRTKTATFESELDLKIEEAPEKLHKIPVAIATSSHISRGSSEATSPAPLNPPAVKSKVTGIEQPQPKEPVTGNSSESELSSLLDEAPPQKKGRKKQQGTASASANAKPSKSTKTKKTSDDRSDSQETEIKRLQGWLVKCGIRKTWSKVLTPYNTPNAKINHLKELLRDVGMEGRYSVEKARKIKERREFAEDLEAVQEGAKRWGHADSDEEGAEPQARRRLAGGIKRLDFGSDDEN